MAKEYLSQYELHKRKYNRYLSEYRSEIEVIRNIQKNLNVIPAQQRREAEANLNRYIMYCNGLKRKAEESASGMDEIQAMIESIPGLEGDILKLRYIDGLIWEDICESVHYSWHSVFHKHDKALKMVEERLENQQNIDE